MNVTTLWARSGLMVNDVRSFFHDRSWHDPVETPSYGIVIPIEGRFRRRSSGFEHPVNRGNGFFRHRGEEVQVAHPFGEPEAATIIDVDLDVLRVVDDADWPRGPRVIEPRLALQHRLLRRNLHRFHDPLVVEFHVLDMLDGALRPTTKCRPGRSTTAQRVLVADVIDRLQHDPGELTLARLANDVGCSPFHLSRTFRSVTGLTLSGYRARARVHEVLHLLDQGADDLTRIAVDCGFADHSHMTRTVTELAGETPSRIPELLRSAS